MTWTKKGEAFLPQITKKELKVLYKKEKKSKPKMRLLAAMLRKEGKSISDISFSLQKPRMTISDWLRRFSKEDISKSIYDIRQSGKPPKLNKKQQNKLDQILSLTPDKQGIPFKIWTTSLVQYIIKEKFGIHFKPRNVRYIVDKLGFSFIKPRQKHKKANKKLQEEFKKKLKQKSNITLNLDLRSSFLMKRTSL